VLTHGDPGEWGKIELQKKGGAAEQLTVEQASNNMEYEIAAFMHLVSEHFKLSITMTS
jgi:hypothetical protein